MITTPLKPTEGLNGAPKPTLFRVIGEKSPYHLFAGTAIPPWLRPFRSGYKTLRHPRTSSARRAASWTAALRALIWRSSVGTMGIRNAIAKKGGGEAKSAKTTKLAI